MVCRKGFLTNEEVRSFLEGEGFQAAVNSYFGWYRLADGVLIVDAKPDNFILTECGIVPIDLQMALVDPGKLRAAFL
ncbi:MAG TPA: hypothetical protein VIS74_02050 [Chthoniobacterales bacterium]